MAIQAHNRRRPQFSHSDVHQVGVLGTDDVQTQSRVLARVQGGGTTIVTDPDGRGGGRRQVSW